jgi:6-phosphogluconolactonase
MVHPLRPDLRLFPTPQALVGALAEAIAAAAQASARASGAFTLCLAGGSTPRALFERLARDHRSDIPWAQTSVYWGDERYVPHSHPESNYRMARETLLDRVPILPSHIHPMPTFWPEPDRAARGYEATLTQRFGQHPRFDLVLLGLGADGHTASLFPHSPALAECDRWVVPTLAPTEPRRRLTLTFPVLNSAAQVFFLVAGAEKAEALRCALTPTAQREQCPAAGVRPTAGDAVWWADAAAGRLVR